MSKVYSGLLWHVDGTWKVICRHVGIAVMSNTDHHSVKNVFLLLAILVLRLNVPLARISKIWSLLYTQDFGLNNRKTESDNH